MRIVLDTSERSSQVFQLPFKSITIADARFDTTHVGIYSLFNNMFIPVIRNYKINFEGGTGKNFGIYFNKFFKKNLGNNDAELLCILKKLSIIKRDTLAENESINKAFGQINFQTDVFLRSGDNFYAAFKIDTILIESVGTKKKDFTEELREYLLMPALRILQNKITNTDWEKVIKRKSFAKSIVYENYFINRFNLPILTQQYKKGIYRTFSEFINNSPSIIYFKVKKEKAGGVSILDTHGNYLVTTKIFGFNDGEKCWIQRGIFCYPLIRTGNGFEFFLTIVSNLKILLAIDMEKGNIY